MAEDIKLHIENLHTNGTDPIEFIIREGKVPEPTLVERSGQHFESTLVGPFDYYTKRKKHFVEPVIHYCKQRGFIHLIDNPFVDVSRTKISGSIKANPIWNEMGINTGKRYATGKELTQKLRQYMHLFVDPSKFADLMRLENKLKGKISGEVDFENNKRGSLKSNHEFNFNAEGVATDFAIKAPVYIGAEAATVSIDLFFDPRSDGITFYLESTELIKLLSEEIESAVQNQIDKFLEYDPSIPILEVV